MSEPGPPKMGSTGLGWVWIGNVGLGYIGSVGYRECGLYCECGLLGVWVIGSVGHVRYVGSVGCV